MNNDMNINIQSVHFKASDDLQKHIHEKLRKLFVHSDKIIRADVKLFEEGNGQTTQFCEIRLVIPGDDHIAKKGAETYEKAVLDTVDTLRKMIRRAKK
ncbi:MAG: ribosome-associated translation inhibitor RaiA [Lewinellaceae bacterium]|nr:ribosome-associated translation inhibitor RaiA [Saprospiraceae bacterium]MCB9314910.1 ribosome-associated translation inhibitor RaiA [Lewinellaceae bacterium]MCB9331701.1 ribosome-associated translation inhibitor RaiA [Lewinellaceae bacterium]